MTKQSMAPPNKGSSIKARMANYCLLNTRDQDIDGISAGAPLVSTA